MKITKIEALVFSKKVPKEHQLNWDGKAWGLRQLVVHKPFVKISTDEGIIGMGEPNISPNHLKVLVEETKPYLLGRDPCEIDNLSTPAFGEPISQDIMYVAYLAARGKPGFLAGINEALWDIAGKSAKAPVWKLLGGHYTDKVEAYASCGELGNTVEDISKEAARMAELGFKGYKLRVTIKDYLEKVKAARDALGDDVDLMIEWNFRLPNAKTAISAIKKVERYELAWVEEPIPLGDIDGYAEIRAAVETPISGGELLTSRYLFKERIDRGAYDIVQPDCCRMGISEAWKVAFLASLKGLPCVPHNWSGNGLNTAAQLNLLAAIPNHWYLESNESYYGTCPTFKKLLFDGSPVPKKGYFYVPKRPGLGVELNKEVATECAYIDGPSTAPI